MELEFIGKGYQVNTSGIFVWVIWKKKFLSTKCLFAGLEMNKQLGYVGGSLFLLCGHLMTGSIGYCSHL